MYNPAQEGIEAARLEAKIRSKMDDLINAGLAPHPDDAADDIDADQRLWALATAAYAYDDSRARGFAAESSAVLARLIADTGAYSDSARAYAAEHIDEAIAAAENDREEERIERAIEATRHAYDTARRAGSDVPDAIVAAIQAGIAAGSSVEEAGFHAGLAHQSDDDDDTARRQEARAIDYDLSATQDGLADAARDGRHPIAATIHAALQFWWDNAPIDITLPAAIAGASYTATGLALHLTDGATYTLPIRDDDDDDGPATEAIAAEAIQAAYLQMRDDDLAGAEHALASYARQIAYQPHSMTETQSDELAQRARAVYDARQARAATRHNYGIPG